MRKEINLEKKFCGNCKWHNVYNYPNFIFCFERYMDHKDPVMSTLDCCEGWEPHNAECFCVKEAMSDRNHRIETMGIFMAKRSKKAKQRSEEKMFPTET